MEYLYYLAQTINHTEVGIPNVAADDNALNVALRLTFTVTGAVSLLLVLIGAFRYVSSNGDQSTVKQAKDTILYSLVGLVVSLTAFVIVQVVLGVLYG